MNLEGARKLLLVEDEAIIALKEKATLESFGYESNTVHSGEKTVVAVADGRAM